jgi:tRNA-specific adenosine deaminase 3
VQIEFSKNKSEKIRRDIKIPLKYSISEQMGLSLIFSFGFLDQKTEKSYNKKMRIEILLPPNQSHELELEQVYVTSIQPKNAAKLIAALANYCPPALPHLKRIERPTAHKNQNQSLMTQAAQEMKLKFLLFPLKEIEKEELSALLSSFEFESEDFDLEIVQVPKHAPMNRQQFEEWKHIWPMGYHEKVDPKLIEPVDETAVEQWMTRVLELHSTSLDQNASEHRNTAIIVDPISNTQRVISQDSRRDHPLHHALMKAVDLVAQDELKTRIQNGKRERSPNDSKLGYLCTGLDLYIYREPCVMYVFLDCFDLRKMWHKY